MSLSSEILVCPVEWVTDVVAEQVFGLSRDRLIALRKSGEVRWKYIPNYKTKNAKLRRVLTNAQSIRDWLERLPDAE